MLTYVIGHKNPDTDAICSAIAYADLLSRTTVPDAIPARCGELNQRTQFVLQQAGMPIPRLITDVRPTLGNIMQREPVSTREDESLHDVFEIMTAHNFRNIPVVDSEKRVVGLVSIVKMLEHLFPPSSDDPLAARIVSTNLKRILKSVQGTSLHLTDPLREQDFILTVAASAADYFSERIAQYPSDRLLIVVGNRPTIHQIAINQGVRALIITSNAKLEDHLLKQALDKGVSVIFTSQDTATCTLAIKCAKPIHHALSTDFISFSENTLISEAQEIIQHKSQVLFPVIEADGRLMGVFSKSDLVISPRARLVLVDHNEFSQAVTGVEYAEVIEVIDHHRLGGNLVTTEPIRFINDPLGSTCTIISRLYQQNQLVPSSAIALCLAAGIISDTLYLTSPTTTPQDREALDWLRGLVLIDLDQFSKDFFACGSPLLLLPSEDAVRLDAKEYNENGYKIIAAQIEELGFEQFWKRRHELQEALEELRLEKRADFACLMITNITLHQSLLLVTGNKKMIDAIDYPALAPNLYELGGIVSRKKELLPVLIRIARQIK
jgi:manganese-dependent inorganic pyrophosphatase